MPRPRGGEIDDDDRVVEDGEVEVRLRLEMLHHCGPQGIGPVAKDPGAQKIDNHAHPNAFFWNTRFLQPEGRIPQK